MLKRFNRRWAMPNHQTFDINCIHNFIGRYIKKDILSIDPFANTNKFAKITNDLDPDIATDYTLDALDFVRLFSDGTIDLVLFDPPYSSRQVSEHYKRLGRTVNSQTTQGSFWKKIKKEISRVVTPGGWVLSFGWNSNGIGKTNGFQLIEILLVAHGGIHNDTICVAEQKISMF